MIILEILKIIGIVVGCIVGLAVLLVLMVALCPIVYRLRSECPPLPADIETDQEAGLKKSAENITAKASARWLLGIISAVITYEGGRIAYYVRVCGIKVYKGNADTSEKGSKKDADRKDKDSSDRKTDKKSVKPAAADKKRPGTVIHNISTSLGNASKITLQPDPGEYEDETSAAARADDDSENHTSEIRKPADKKTSAEHIKKSESEIRSDGKKKSRNSNKKNINKKKTVNKKKKKTGLLKNIREKAAYIKELKDDSKVRLALRHLKIEIMNLLRHIKPEKIKGNIKIGMEAPDSTALVYAAAANATALLETDIMVIPDMDKQNLEYHISVKGKIFIGYLAVLALRLLLDKNVLYFIKKIRSGKNG